MSAVERVTRTYDEAETQAAKAMEQLVGTGGFGGLLGQLAENTAALTRIGTDTMDLFLRNLRVAGRRDVVRLSGQLARTEDKLERVLQEVEELHAELAKQPTPRGSANSHRRGTAAGVQR
jgi:hypothetical protein